VAGSEVPWLGSNPPAVGPVNAIVRLLLSHSPDQMTFARQNGYQLMLSGHTHGGQVVLPVIGPMFAPSMHGVSFAAGLFEWPGFTLHVSRGIGAKDPLRWRCCPELTCLHVQS
jgi:predicted MPP superfamily phosphohydrolase